MTPNEVLTERWPNAVRNELQNLGGRKGDFYRFDGSGWRLEEDSLAVYEEYQAQSTILAIVEALPPKRRAKVVRALETLLR